MILLTFHMPDLWPDLVLVLLIGAVAGWLASMIMNTKGGLIRNIIFGIVGGYVGRFVLGLFGISASNILGTILVSAAGACIVVWLIHKLAK